MKIKIWTLTSDTDSGMTTNVYTSAEAAYESLVDIMQEANEDEVIANITAKSGTEEWYKQVLDLHSEFNDNGYYDVDSHSVEEHEVEINTTAVQPPKILIEVKGGGVQRVVSDTDLKIVVVDHDNADVGDDPVSGVISPETIYPDGELRYAFVENQELFYALKDIKF